VGQTDNEHTKNVSYLYSMLRKKEGNLKIKVPTRMERLCHKELDSGGVYLRRLELILTEPSCM